MAAPKEIELKLEVPPAGLPALGKLPFFQTLKSPIETENEISVYFDTDNQKLRKHGLMLRVRRIGKRRVQTIKATGEAGLFARGEWEREIATPTPNLRLARGTPLERLLSRKLCRRLKPIFETRVRRTTYCLTDDDRALAVTLDKGRIDTGERSQPLSEIEIELKRGREHALFDLARTLADALPVQLALKSKAERGYELLERADLRAAKAGPIDLRRHMGTRDGFRAIGRTCLKQIVDNVPTLRAGDPEGVHQMRVGLRRLRAAISLFRDILPDPETAALKRELKWLTGELAQARELEVLVTRVVAPVKGRHSRRDGISSLAHDLAQQRAAAIEHAKAAIQSARFRRLLLDIAAWLEIGQLTDPQDDLVRDRGDIPVAPFAAAELARRWNKLRKKGKSLQKLDPRGRHKLRIQGKKLRYASEFFASLFPGKKAAKRRQAFLSGLEDLQDCLGDLNDIAVHEDLIAANAGLSSRRRRRRKGCKRAFAAGLLTGREDARFETTLERAIDAYAALGKGKPFW